MRALLLLSVFALPACDGPDPVETGDTEETDTFDTNGFDTGVPDLTEVKGVVSDPNGNGVEGVQIDLCLTVCRTTFSDSGGAFSVLGNPGEQHSLHIHGNSSYAEMLVPFPVNADFSAPQDLNPRLQTLEAAKALGASAEEIEVASGLHLTLKEGDLAIDLVPDPITEVTGVRVALPQALPLGLEGNVLAVWHLSPYDAEQEGGTPLSFTNDFSLEAGASAKVYTASYYDFDWIEEGTVTVSEDGSRLSADGVTLSRLTTVVLVGAAAE